jgi:hypothetical protein
MIVGSLQAAGLFYVAMCLGILVVRGRQGQWRLGLKAILQVAVYSAGLLWAVFFLMFIAVLLPGLVAYLGSVPLASEFAWVRAAVPQFYILSGMVITLYVVYRVNKWEPKWTLDEAKLLNEENARIAKRLGPLGRFVRSREKA